MKLRYLLAPAALFVAGLGTAALADLNYTAGTGTVIFDFLCFTTKHCSAHVNIKNDGTEIFTSGNPGQVTIAGGLLSPGQAVSAGSAPVVVASDQSPIPVRQSNPYPVGAVVYTASATGTTAATTATLAGAASVTTYICGFSIRANATAAATGNSTVTGTITGTLNFTQWTAPNASGLGVTEMIFVPCVPASAANTSVAVVSAAPGTGGVVSVTAWGYKL